MSGKNFKQEGPPEGTGTAAAAKSDSRVYIRCSRSWAVWLAQVASHCDLTLADFLAQAAARQAEAWGYNFAPPKRLVSREPGEVSHRATAYRFGEGEAVGRSAESGEG